MNYELLTCVVWSSLLSIDSNSLDDIKTFSRLPLKCLLGFSAVLGIRGGRVRKFCLGHRSIFLAFSFVTGSCCSTHMIYARCIRTHRCSTHPYLGYLELVYACFLRCCAKRNKRVLFQLKKEVRWKERTKTMVEGWVNEKTNWHDGVLTQENWYPTGHYTQVVWRDTKHVGCGIATGSNTDYLVCRYSPGQRHWACAVIETTTTNCFLGILVLRH